MMILRRQIMYCYSTVISPKPGRQNSTCGANIMKQKEVSDILDAMKRLHDSGPDRHVQFVAITTNIPPCVHAHPNPDDVRH